MKNYDKSLLEVWEWKEHVYNDVKKLSAKEYVDRIRQDAEKLLGESSILLKSISARPVHQKAS